MPLLANVPPNASEPPKLLVGVVPPAASPAIALLPAVKVSPAVDDVPPNVLTSPPVDDPLRFEVPAVGDPALALPPNAVVIGGDVPLPPSPIGGACETSLQANSRLSANAAEMGNCRLGVTPSC